MSRIPVWFITRETENFDGDFVSQENRLSVFCNENGYEVVGHSILRGGRANKVYTLKKTAKEQNFFYFVTTTRDQISVDEEEAVLILEELLGDLIRVKFSDEPYRDSVSLVNMYRVWQELKEHGFKFNERTSKRKPTFPSGT